MTTTNRALNITVPRQGSEGRGLIEDEGRGEGANRSGRARGGTAGVKSNTKKKHNKNNKTKHNKQQTTKKHNRRT
jgi:hypothetical protein